MHRSRCRSDFCSASAALDAVGELCGVRSVGLCGARAEVRRRSTSRRYGNFNHLRYTSFYRYVCAYIVAISYSMLLIEHVLKDIDEKILF